MLKVTTASGTVYHLHMDTGNYQRIRSETASDLGEDCDTGVFEYISPNPPQVGFCMLIVNPTHWVRSTPVVSVEDVA